MAHQWQNWVLHALIPFSSYHTCEKCFWRCASTREYHLSESGAPSLQRSSSHWPSPTAGWPFWSSGQASGITACQQHSTPRLGYHLCLQQCFTPCTGMHTSAVIETSTSVSTAVGLSAWTLVTPWQFSLEVKNHLPNIQTPLSLILLFPKVIPERFTSQSKTPRPAGNSSPGNPLSYLVHQLNSKVPLRVVFPCEITRISTQCETMPSKDLMCHADIHFNKQQLHFVLRNCHPEKTIFQISNCWSFKITPIQAWHNKQQEHLSFLVLFVLPRSIFLMWAPKPSLISLSLTLLY